MCCVMMTQFAHSSSVSAIVTFFHTNRCDAIWNSHSAKIIIYIINMLYSFSIILGQLKIKEVPIGTSFITNTTQT